MRIQLVLQVFQLRFRLLPLSFYQTLFRLTPTQTGTNGRTQPGDKYHHPHIPRIEYPSRWNMTRKFRRRRRTYTFQKYMKKHTQAEYQHGIAQNILTHFIREHIAGNQPQVIDIEDNEIAQRNTTVPQELGQVKAASPVHKDQREAKYEQPTDDMDAQFQKTSL